VTANVVSVVPSANANVVLPLNTDAIVRADLPTTLIAIVLLAIVTALPPLNAEVDDNRIPVPLADAVLPATQLDPVVGFTIGMMLLLTMHSVPCVMLMPLMLMVL